MLDGKGYILLRDDNGTIHISDDVIASIATSALLEVDGIHSMMQNSTSVTDFVTNKKNAKSFKGVHIEVLEDALVMDVYVMIKYGFTIPEVAENAQNAVKEAVSAMTGCQVQTVNVHVGGISLN